MRLASYNIRKAVGLDWRRRPERILAVLDEVAADVAVLQEADKRLGPRPAALPHAVVEAHGWTPIDPGPGPSLGWHGNAVLLRPGFTGEVVERLTLPGVEPRGALVVRITSGGTSLTLVATHLGLSPGARHRQVTAILTAVKDIAGPLVIAGDLNERAPARLLPAHGHRLTVVTPGLSFHAAKPFVALDHLIVAGGVAVKETGVHISPLSRTASDHLPIWADLGFAQAAASRA